MILLFPAGLRCLSSEARGWSWLIYEPSPHPAPPVSLVFLIFSAQTAFPKPHPATLPRDDLATSGDWSTGPGPSGEGGAKGVDEAFGVFQPLVPPPRAGG